MNRIIFQPPPFIYTINEYPNLNKDPVLREKMTKRFLKIVLSNNKFKKFHDKLKSDKGYEIILTILKLFVKNKDVDFAYLLDYKESVLNYILKKLNNI